MGGGASTRCEARMDRAYSKAVVKEVGCAGLTDWAVVGEVRCGEVGVGV